jgi:hypothetical protein
MSFNLFSKTRPQKYLCSIQLMCYLWFHHRKFCLQPPIIDFASILHQLILQSNIIPYLPPMIIRLTNPHLRAVNSHSHNCRLISFYSRGIGFRVCFYYTNNSHSNYNGVNARVSVHPVTTQQTWFLSRQFNT